MLRSRRAVVGRELRAADLVIAGERIAAVEAWREARGLPVVDIGDAALLPGVVDTHVHVNDPGRADWEGFPNATRAAAAGGVTTVVDMPLNSVPATTSAAGLEAKVRALAGRCWVDVGLWGGLVPGNLGELDTLAARVLGFKAFLVDPGVPEFPPVGPSEIAAAAPRLAALNRPLLVHAEDPQVVASACRRAAGHDPRRHETWLAARPEAAEFEAIERLLGVCSAAPFRLHVVHVASAGALPLLRDARAAGIPVTGETCPHYLTFAAEEVADGDTMYKCAPPIRERRHREALWRALGAGDLELVASDHSPCPPGLKLPAEGDFLRAWGGIASLQLALPALWTGARRRGFGLVDLARWLARNPARLAGLAGRKGELAVGYDADLVAFDPERRFTVDPDRLEHRHPLTPYAGMELDGTVAATWLRGAEVARDGRLLGRPRGRLLAP